MCGRGVKYKNYVNCKKCMNKDLSRPNKYQTEKSHKGALWCFKSIKDLFLILHRSCSPQCWGSWSAFISWLTYAIAVSGTVKSCLIIRLWSVLNLIAPTGRWSAPCALPSKLPRMTSFSRLFDSWHARSPKYLRIRWWQMIDSLLRTPISSRLSNFLSLSVNNTQTMARLASTSKKYRWQKSKGAFVFMFQFNHPSNISESVTW